MLLVFGGTWAYPSKQCMSNLKCFYFYMQICLQFHPLQFQILYFEETGTESRSLQIPEFTMTPRKMLISIGQAILWQQTAPVLSDLIQQNLLLAQTIIDKWFSSALYNPEISCFLLAISSFEIICLLLADDKVLESLPWFT